MPHRRQLLAFCTGSWLAEIGLASASDWPDRPVSLVVPFAPGGVTDIAARVVAESLTRLLLGRSG
jgi:tripartite-type tricarboxylate transporter receptor subunit TctC